MTLKTRISCNLDWLLIIFLTLSVGLRVVNLNKALYFTWDQGRDFFAVEKIAHGDLVLVGQTTGIQGFFYGPLWYYLGLPGYLIGHASPAIFTYWYLYICLAATLPLIWWLTHRLFSSKKTAALAAFALSLSPGFIWTSLRVWNILTALPLLLGSLVAFTYAKKSRLALAASFFLLALLLQSEFAYGIFLVVPLWLLTGFVRGKATWKDYLISASSIFVTLIPQLLFDLRNHWLMSKSLLSAVTSSGSNSIGWLEFWTDRSAALIQTSMESLIGRAQAPLWLTVMLTILLISGLISVFRVKAKTQIDNVWRLIGFATLLPYIFFMLWRGNGGFFFAYYLSPHIVLLGLILIRGWLYLIKQLPKLKWLWLSLAVIIGYFWLNYLYHIAINPVNNAGWAKMNQAITQILDWSNQDNQTQPVVKVLTPNRETEHYDAIIHHQFTKAGKSIPLTVRTNQEQYWYVLEEPDPYHPDYVKNWYVEARAGGKLLREQQIGDLLVQTWTASNSAQVVR